MAKALEQQIWPYEVYSQPKDEPKQWPGGVKLSLEDIEGFSRQMLDNGFKLGTVKQYQYCLNRFYADLPEDKTVYADSIDAWRDKTLAEGFAPRTINTTISAVNRLLGYLGRRDLQTTERAKTQEPEVPELSRAEYLRMLSTAKNLGKEKAYLLTKVFASMVLPVQELKLLTVEAVKKGVVELPAFGGKVEELPVPTGLQQELLSYAGRSNIATGPIFRTREGKPMWRTNVTFVIGNLCEEARVPVEKGNPRCLRQLYQSTMAGIEENVARLVKQEYSRLLDCEQAYIGWDN